MATVKTILCPRVGLLIRKNMVHEQAVNCFTHEAIVLAAIHGEEAVRPDPDVKQASLEASELVPSVEYDRLTRNYGAPAESDQPYTEIVFGPRQLGNLQAQMGKSVDDLFTDMNLEDEFEEDEIEDDGEIDSAEDSDDDNPPKLEVVQLTRKQMLEKLADIQKVQPDFKYTKNGSAEVVAEEYKAVIVAQLAALDADMQGFDAGSSVHELAAVLEAA